MPSPKHVSTKECVTFAAETEDGCAWMGRRYQETTRAYALDNPIARAEAERFKKDAAADGLETYGRLPN